MSKAIILVLLLVLESVAAQTILHPQKPPPFDGALLGNCDSFHDLPHAKLVQLVALQIGTEAVRQNPDVGPVTELTIHESRVTCLSFGTRTGKFSSASVLATYSCTGPACNIVQGRAHFSFKCAETDTWTLYDENEFEFNTANYNPRSQSQPLVSPPGSCSICFNVARATNNRIGTRNSTTQCLECSSRCLQAPSSGCIPVPNTDDWCAVAAYKGDWVDQCPFPHFALISGTNICLDRVTVTNSSQSSSGALCAGDRVTFNCSISPAQFVGGTEFMWRVTYPGMETINITFNDPSSLVSVDEMDGNIMVVTTKFERERYYESILTATIMPNVTFAYIDIECVLRDYDPKKAIFNNSHYVPNKPVNFSIVTLTKHLRITVATLQWALDIPVELSRPDTVEIVFSPTPTQPPSRNWRSPYEVILDNDMEFNATLIVRNCAGVNSSTIAINTVRLPHNATIVNVLSNETSTGIMSLTVPYGYPPPSFNCLVDAHPLVNYSTRWAINRSTSYAIHRHRQGSLLTWLRALDDSDTGLYLCQVQVPGYISHTVGVNIRVKYPATLSSTFSKYPVSVATYSDYYFVPEGFIGTLVTCSGWGQQPWMLQWTMDDAPLNSERFTSRLNQRGLFFSIDLINLVEFTAADDRNFSCILRTQDSSEPQVKSVQLRAVLEPVPSMIPPDCPTKFGRKFFQIRMLGVSDCSFLPEGLRINISRGFELTLRSAVAATCGNCSVSIISVTSTAQCSISVSDGIVIWGTIRSLNLTERYQMFCSLSNWLQSSPEVLLQIRDSLQFYRVDRSCPVEIGSVMASGCEVPSERLILAFISTALIMGPLTIVIIAAMYLGIAILHCRTVWRKRFIDPDRKLYKHISGTDRVIITYGNESGDVRYRTGIEGTASIANNMAPGSADVVETADSRMKTKLGAIKSFLSSQTTPVLTGKKRGKF